MKMMVAGLILAGIALVQHPVKTLAAITMEPHVPPAHGCVLTPAARRV